MFKAFERRLAIVMRWGIMPKLFQQSVAEHSFYVALYTDKLCQMLPIPDDVRAQAVAKALRHDMVEVMHGDIPGPAKRRMGVEDDQDWHLLRAATDGDYIAPPMSPEASALIDRIVKMADYIDAAMFLQREIMTGNSAVGDIYRSHVGKIKDLAPKIGLTNVQTGHLIGDIQMAASIRLPL